MDVVLVMFLENGSRREFPLGEGMTIIGRREDCDLRIPLADISRQHATLIIQGGEVTLRDHGSANGTYVNNQRITEVVLAPGDHIVIGPVVFTVQIDGEPSDLRRVKTRLETRHRDDTAPARTPADASARTEISEIDEDDLFGGSAADADPISALEQLAASGEQIFIDDSPENEPTNPPEKK